MNLQIVRNLNKLKNASLVRKEFVTLEYNFFFFRIIQKLYKEGLIQSYVLKKIDKFGKKQIVVNLRYYFDKPILRKLQVLSNISKHKVLDYHNISRMKIKKDILFLSTDQGILTQLECKRKRLGGVLIFIC